MGNPLLGDVLANAFGRNNNSRMNPGGMGGGLRNAALGALLGRMMSRGGAGGIGGMRGSGNRGMLLAMLLPLAMNWVQKNGGIGAVLDKFKQSGLGSQARSWVSTGANEPAPPETVRQVIGDDDIAQMAAKLGVSEEEVSQAFSEILPEMTDQLTPQGHVPPDADESLKGGRDALQDALRELHNTMGEHT